MFTTILKQGMSKRAQDIKAGSGHEEDRGSVKNVMATLGVTWFTDEAKVMVKVGNFERQPGVNNEPTVPQCD